MTRETILSEALADRRIEAARLVLRTYRKEDFEALLEITSDPATFRFSERGPMGSEETWARLLRNIGHWAVLGHGLFAVEEKLSGRFIGEAGLADFRRGLGDRFDAAPEASWTIAPAEHNRGYATEAMAAALGWAEERLGVRRTVCLIHVQNGPSLRVAEKLGYRPFERCDYKGYPALLLER